MKNKRILTLFVLLFVATAATLAQPAGGQHKSREQLAETLAKHISEKLSLNDNEAVERQFVQTYCAYMNEIFALGPSIPAVSNNMSDAEVERILKARFERSEKIICIREKYHKKFSEFLTARQIEQVYELDRSMMRRLSKNKKTAQ